MSEEKTGKGAALRVSVRELVAFCFPPEDILPGGGTEEMLVGGRAHRLRQETWPGETERVLRHGFSLRGETAELYGRADAFLDGETPLIEEMKLSRRTEGLLPEHQAQATLYAAMAALEGNRERATWRVTYLNGQGETLRSYEKTEGREALCARAEEMLSRWLSFALREREHRRRRDASIQALGFPYASYRRGQRELAVQTYTAIRRRRRLFATLPTGTGKSAATLFPALKAMGEGETDKILYLTARNTARQSPLQALEKMREGGLRVRAGVLTAREKLCPEKETRCHPDFCSRARGHYLRQEAAVEELLREDAPFWTDEVVREAARKHTLCPFELALHLSELADVALMDMNYLFDPFAQIKRLYPRRRSMTVLADEAHHTLERVRESLSGQLDGQTLAAARTMIGKAAGRKHPCYQALTRLLRCLRALEPPPDERLEALPCGVREAAEEVSQTLSLLLEHPQGTPLGELYALLRQLLPFLYAADRLQEEEYAILLEPRGKERVLSLYCLLPGPAVARATKSMRGAIFFSATLSPLPAMKELLGGQEEDACFALPSPFPREHLRAVCQSVSTRYGDREKSARAVADVITRTVNVRRGNYLAFFPSYAYLRLVLDKLDPERLPPLWTQRPDGGEEERESFFAAFTEENAPRLGLCVLGGMYAEGIDLPGEKLIGVIVVGVGLPTPSARLRAAQRCCQERFGDGFGYACRIPGMQKVLQAGGRLIRSETDRGLLVLLDSRYQESAYAALLPEEWKPLGKSVEQAAKELWP